MSILSWGGPHLEPGEAGDLLPRHATRICQEVIHLLTLSLTTNPSWTNALNTEYTSILDIIITRTNCPYAATFLDIYSIIPPMYIYIYINTYIHIYKYIYIYNYMFYSSIFWQHFHSGCYAWKSLIIWTF